MDRYRFRVLAGFEHVAFVATTTDVLPLEILENDGVTPVAAGDASVEATLAAGATHLLKVGPGGAAPACGSGYDLDALISPAPPAP